MATCTIYLLTVLAAISGFLFGYDTGVISGAILQIRKQFGLSSFMQELVVSVTVGAAALMSLGGGVINYYCGRKITIIVSSFMFVAGTITMAISNHVWILLVGRTLVGVAVGLGSMTTPMYLAECSPPNIRGTMVTINNMFITGGQFVASLVSGAFSYDSVNGWRYMLGVAAFPSIIQLFGFLALPKSPRWLIQNGRLEDARKVLVRLRGCEDVSEEYDMMQLACYSDAENRGGFVLWRMLQYGPVRRALFIGCCLQMFQQLAGINTVMYYSATIIKMAGVGDDSEAIWLSSLTSCANFLFTIVGICLVDRIGRRKLLIGSIVGVMINLLVLSGGFKLIADEFPPVPPHSGSLCGAITTCTSCVTTDTCGICYSDLNNTITNSSCLLFNSTSHDTPCNQSEWSEDTCPSSRAWLVILAMVTYLAFFAPGMGPMPWTINSEIYPMWARGPANAITTTTNWTFNLIVSLTFLTLSRMGPMPWTINSEIYPMWARGSANAITTTTNWTFNLIVSLTFLTLTTAPPFPPSHHHSPTTPPFPHHTTIPPITPPFPHHTTIPPTTLPHYYVYPGMGPMPWTINSEIYPMWARGPANAITTTTNWTFNLIVSLTFLTLTETITKAGAFLLYAIIVFGALLFFLFLLPETKGRQLEEIEQLFTGEICVYTPCKKKRFDSVNFPYETLPSSVNLSDNYDSDEIS